MAPAKRPIPEGFRTVTAQLTLDDAAAAIDDTSGRLARRR